MAKNRPDTYITPSGVRMVYGHPPADAPTPAKRADKRARRAAREALTAKRLAAIKGVANG